MYLNEKNQENTKKKRSEKTKMKKIKKQIKGITLIALVVTIIVLLILAGVALTLTIGQNGVFSRAQDAVDIYKSSEEKQDLEMAVASCKMKNINSSKILKKDLEDEIRKQFGNSKDFLVTDNRDGSFLVNMNDTKRMYYIDETGKIIEQSKILKISTADELKAFRDDINSGNNYEGWYVYVTNNITLNIEEEWEPIGRETVTDDALSDENPSFKGIFDGSNYEFNGLKISSIEENANGLFGLVKNAKIKNIKIGSNTNINAKNNLGGITGIAVESVIYNCHNFSEIYSDNGLNIAGIVGNSIKSSIINCSNSNNIISTTGGRLGGIAGSAVENSMIKNCCNMSEISGGTFIGGIVGWSQTNSIYDSCYNNANVYGTGNSIGGIIGTGSNNSITNCYNMGDISSSNGYNVAGIVGASNFNSIENCYTIGSNSGVGNVGDFYGYNKDTTLKNNYSNKDSFSYLDLGSAFKEDKNNINLGYPILEWQ